MIRSFSQAARGFFRIADLLLAVALWGTGTGMGMGTVGAQEEPSLSPALQEKEAFIKGSAAFGDALYDIAANHFATLLTGPATVSLSGSDREWLVLRLAESHVRAHQPEAALARLRVITDNPRLEPWSVTAQRQGKFWSAIALKMLGRAPEAERGFAELLNEEQGAVPFEETCRFSHAQVLASMGRWEDAIGALREAIAAGEPEAAARARVALGEILFRLGRKPEIDEVFSKEMPQPYLAQMKYLLGQAALDRTPPEFNLARRIFLDVLDAKDQLPQEIVTAARIGLAVAQHGRGDVPDAARILTGLIEESQGTSPLLFEMFSILEGLELHSRTDIKARLEAWVATGNQNQDRAVLARFQLIVAEEAIAPASALPRYSAFVSENPGHPLVTRALLRTAVLHALAAAASDRVEEQAAQRQAAVEALLELKRHPLPGDAAKLADFLEAKARFTIGEAVDGAAGGVSLQNREFAAARFREAMKEFGSAAANAEPGGGPAAVATYDAAIASLRADSRADLADYIAALGRSSELKMELQSSLFLEKGLYLASMQEYRGALEALEKFLAFYPSDPRKFEAHLALAEIPMLEVPPRIRTATQHLDAAASLSGLTDAQRQQLDYTRFWVEESKRADKGSRVEELGLKFLERWKESTWRDSVRMKLGDYYFRNENYLDAQAQFEALESEIPDSPLAEVALFFAAKASVRLSPVEGPKSALALWQRVYDRGGSLSIPARYEQALAKARQQKYAEAAEILRQLLVRDPGPAGEMRYSVLCTLGETLFSQAADDPQGGKDAQEVFARIIEDQSAPPRWRNQALFRLGKCHEKAGDEWKKEEISHKTKAAEDEAGAGKAFDDARKAAEEAKKACSQAKAAYYEVLRSPRSGKDAGSEPPEYLWFYRAGFALIDFLKGKLQDYDAAIAVADSLAETNGARAQRAGQIATQLRLEQFRWKK